MNKFLNLNRILALLSTNKDANTKILIPSKNNNPTNNQTDSFNHRMFSLVTKQLIHDIVKLSRVIMVDTAVRCRLRSGSPAFQIKVKLGTHSNMAQTSPPVGYPLLAVCPLYALVPLRQKKFQSKLR